MYYNYEASHLILLLTNVNIDYKFITIDFGMYDRNSNGRFFSCSMVGEKLQNKTLSIPEPAR